MSQCPECTIPISVTKEISIGAIIICPHCKTPSEVIKQEPIKLTLLPELVEGDWGD